MSFSEAIRGAQAELARLQGPLEKARRVVAYARILSAELLGTVLAAPYGLRALTLHRSLPTAGVGHGQPRQQQSVSILRDVRYGPRPRNVMDIYLPPAPSAGELAHPGTSSPAPAPPPQLAASSSPAAGAEAALREGLAASATGETSTGTHAMATSTAVGAPVVLFCHGGVWATGSKWHYAPMATRLAQAGVITAVMQYTLYPEALIPTMVAEVSRALTWTLDNVGGVGGDPAKVSLVGHSAGAHMCAMALLHRSLEVARQHHAGGQGSQIARQDASAKACSPGDKESAAQSRGTSSSNDGRNSGNRGSEQPTTQGAGAAKGAGAAGDCQEAFADPRMPARFIGIAGVYDIARHYEYERGRDVHELSTMRRACGGEEGFARQSPAVILAGALAREGRQHQADLPPREGRRGDDTGLLGGDAKRCAQQMPQAEQPRWEGGRSNGQSSLLQGEIIARCVGFERAAAPGAVEGAEFPGPAALQTQPHSKQQQQQRRQRQPQPQRNSPAAGSQGDGGVAEREAAVSDVGSIPSWLARPASQFDSYLPPAPAELDTEQAAQRAQQAEQGKHATDAEDGILGLTVQDVLRLPPSILMSSCTDLTVPWYESGEMFWLLHDCGVPSKNLVYNKVSHGDFVVGWRPRATLGSRLVEDEGDLPAFAADLVRVVAEKAEVHFSS